MEARAKEDSILLKYSNASATERVDIMFDNYQLFPRMIRKEEKKTQYKIKSEREFSRSHNRGELGVRVQTSKISSPTEDEAIANVMLDEAMKTGEITDGLLKGIDDAKTYAKEIRIISIMKMDYELLEEFVEDLDDLDCQMMKAFLIKKMYIKEIAAETGMSYDYTKRRLKTLREEITLEVVDCIEMNCGEDM